jgi:hypothetical protein
MKHIHSMTLLGTYIMYNLVDVHWHVLNDTMSQYYLHYYHIFGLSGVWKSIIYYLFNGRPCMEIKD